MPAAAAAAASILLSAVARVYLKANTSKTFSLLQFVVVILAARLLGCLAPWRVSVSVCLSGSLPDLIVPSISLFITFPEARQGGK